MPLSSRGRNLSIKKEVIHPSSACFSRKPRVTGGLEVRNLFALKAAETVYCNKRSISPVCKELYAEASENSDTRTKASAPRTAESRKRNCEALIETMGQALSEVTILGSRSFFVHRSRRPTGQLLR